MSGGVRVKFDDREWKRGIAALGRKFPAAARRALKRTGTTARAQVARDIRADTGLKVGAIKEAIRISQVGADAIQLEARGGRIPLIQFNARGPEPSKGRGGGVKYRIGKKTGRVPSGFIATMGSGHRGVFKRLTTKRLPITELYGPSIMHVFRRLVPSVVPKAREALFKNLRHEFARALGGR